MSLFGIHTTRRPAPRELLLLLLIVLLLAAPRGADALLGLLGRNNKKQQEEEKDKTNRKATTKAANLAAPAAAADEQQPADWTRSQQQHQRPGRRRLETHVDEEEVLNLLQHEPVKLTLEEAQDWQHVKRRLAEAREKSGFFHRVSDAFVPPNSALRRKEREAGDDGASPSDVGMNNGSGSEAEQEYRVFEKLHRFKRREEAAQHQGRVGVDV